MKTTIKIPEKFYAGVKQHGLAFITPEGTDAAAKNRKESVNYWARQIPYEWIEDNSLPLYNGHPQKKRVETGLDTSKYFTFDNTPQEGFKLTKQVTRWSTSNQVWEIEDPRGFRIQLYSSNMFEILMHGSINKGELVGKFVYGREGAHNVLLPLNSDIYQQAAATTKTIKQATINPNTLTIGDKVSLLRQGELIEVIYAGAYYVTDTRVDIEIETGNSYRTYNRYVPRNCKWKDEIKPLRHYFIDIKNHDRTTWRPFYYLINPVKPNVLDVLVKNFWSIQDTNDWMASVLLMEITTQAEAYESRKTQQAGYSYPIQANSLIAMSFTKEPLQALIEERKPYLAQFTKY